MGACMEVKCDRPMHARDLCNVHYIAARSAGELPVIYPRKHVLSEVDIETRSAVCTICGPTGLRVRGGSKGVSCAGLRKEEQARRNEQRRSGGAVFEKYKLTVETLETLASKQNGQCAICQRSLDDPQASRVVDHDHACCPGKTTCGKCVRGLLCRSCNLGLGYFQDDPARILAAARYLAR